MESERVLETEARKRLARASSISETLQRTCQAQNTVIEDLISSIPDPDELREQIAEATSHINECLAQTSNYERILSSHLRDSRNQSHPGDFLKNILTNLQRSLFELAKSQSSVSIVDVIQLEDQLSDVIDSICDQNLSHDSPDAQNAIIKRKQSHTMRIIDLLQFIQAQQAQNLPTST